MRALQITGPGRYEITDIPIPEPREEEVLIKIAGCNTCTQWDLTVWKGVDIFDRPGHPEYPLRPGAPGHEFAGEVVARGAKVTKLQIGDHVATSGGPSRETGAYVEYAVNSQDLTWRMPDQLPFAQAGCCELLSCVCSSILRLGEVVTKRVGVSGLGPAGLLAIQALRARGAREIVGFDIEPRRLPLARELGATHAVLGRSAEWEALTREPLDVAVDCVGVAASVNDLMKVTRDRVLIFGVLHGTAEYTKQEYSRGLKLEGYGRRLPEAGEYAAHLLSSGIVRTDRFITASFPLEQYHRGIDLLAGKDAIKIWYTIANAAS